ncbi:hypothetical protein CDL15_Pgr002472 [Punica granatum]|uniref:Class II aldolase/adducin N-terminal domain-containing protein n=1 Tax=Punica granatum TaxID=22663 RepID=A0A218XU69_PUNGR|nr:hypothetical protein CDL15_Pgr002472 [Punica granatum]
MEILAVKQDICRNFGGFFNCETVLLPLMCCRIEAFPRAMAVLVRNHGMYMRGDSWISAKTQSIFKQGVTTTYLMPLSKLRQLGIEWTTPKHGLIQSGKGVAAEDDLKNGVPGAAPITPNEAGKEEVTAALAANADAMIKADRKITALKELQVSVTGNGSSHACQAIHVYHVCNNFLCRGIYGEPGSIGFFSK